MKVQTATYVMDDRILTVEAHRSAETGSIVTKHGHVWVYVSQDRGEKVGIAFADWRQLLAAAEALRDIAHQAELEEMNRDQLTLTGEGVNG